MSWFGATRSSKNTPQPPKAGYTLAFYDDFTTFTGDAAGTTSWQTLYMSGIRNNAGNVELEYYVDKSVEPGLTVNPGYQPFSIVDGTCLRITGTPTSLTGSNGQGFNYNSGFINSSTIFFMQYGYFEMKAMLPTTQGTWPAFWMMAEAGGWPPEIDVMEVLGNSPTTLYTTVHFGTSGSPQQTGQPNTVANTSTGFHVYGVDWDPTNITWYFDGGQVFQVATPTGLNVPMFMMANLAIGGTFPGNPDGTTVLPANFDIDWIRVWKNASSTGEGGLRAL